MKSYFLYISFKLYTFLSSKECKIYNQVHKFWCSADLIHSGALQHLDNIHIDWPLWLNVEENGTRLPAEKHAEFR